MSIDLVSDIFSCNRFLELITLLVMVSGLDEHHSYPCLIVSSIKGHIESSLFALEHR